MNDNPLLSICIPTYNRADYLKNCLDSIVVQFDDKNVKNMVEIIVSDNASEDNTFELVKSYQKSFDNIKYFRNQKNIGMDENIINSVLRANGKYCWNIGDDDLIQNGAFDLIIKILTEEEVALLTVNFYPFVDIKKSSEKKIFEGNYLIEYINSAKELLSGNYDTGIFGVFIFNKELWLKIDRKNYEKYWSYVEIIFKMTGLARLPLVYLKAPILFTGQDYRWNENGAALFTAIHIKRVFNKLREFGYDKNFIDNQMNMFSRGLPMALIAAKISNLKCSFHNLSIIYKELYKYPLHLLIATLIFFIPNSLFKALKSIKNKFKKI